MRVLPHQLHYGHSPSYHWQGREIGRGAFGVCFEALNTLTGEAVAIKKVSLASLSLSDVLGLQNEVALLARLAHTNVVRYIDTVRTRGSIYVIMEVRGAWMTFCAPVMSGGLMA